MDTKILDGKVAWITGGGTGIGRGIVDTFLTAGAAVAISSRNPDHLHSAKETFSRKGYSVFSQVADVTHPDEIEAALERLLGHYGKIDILVNNAGVSGPAPLVEMGNAQWERIVSTNLSGPFYCTRAVLQKMRDHAHGRIINIASVLGKFGVAGYTAYCTTKHGIIGFTRALAVEVAGRGITVNAICPGWVDTAMAQEGIAAAAKDLGIEPEEFRKMAEKGIPTNRFTEVGEVGALAVYLASEASANMTGQALNLCGGATTA